MSKTGRKDSKFTIDKYHINSKFTIGKYHINTMNVIKLFCVNIFMPVTKFPPLTIWLFCKRGPFWIFGLFRRLFKETNGKNWGFYVEEERERKNMDGLFSSSNMGTKNCDQKERVNF